MRLRGCTLLFAYAWRRLSITWMKLKAVGFCYLKFIRLREACQRDYLGVTLYMAGQHTIASSKEQ